MKWTDEQYDAIMRDQSSIIVSAGAGSGKTAVLTERVIRKIKDGVNINELLILTFTNKAASEMRERIRKALKKYSEFSEQLKLLDEAYITTFDSFALSTLKKYHYVLNLSKNISIVDASMIYLEKEKIINEIFENFYKKEDSDFLKLISDFCIKDDIDIKKYIINIYNGSNLLIDKNFYFDNYFNTVLSEQTINNSIVEFENMIKERFNEIAYLLDEIANIDYEYYEKLNSVLIHLLEAIDYDEIVANLGVRLPSISKNCDEDVKKYKENISKILKNLKDTCEYNSIEDIKKTINLTFDSVKVIIKIIRELDIKLLDFKKKNNVYEFNDISIMLISLLENNKEICDEIKEHYKEIMIDEYQDTSDIQETLVNLISNNNVYMVGDIKQSIYRFRNANPDIFKAKYDKYSHNNGGIKIDLNKNFRSRYEVLNNINLIFSQLMSIEVGGADYNNGHAMIYGNKSYDELMANPNYNMDILNYSYDKNLGFTKEETEIFIIANDIKNKIKNKYQVVDKNTWKNRDCDFKDFVILVDRSTNFDLFKKIFEYMHIPLTIYKDEKLNNEFEITVIKNIIKLILKIKNNEIDNEFKYLFVSIARSFVFEYSDNDIFKLFYDNNFTQNDIYVKCKFLSEMTDFLTNSMLIDKIINDFSVMENIVKLGNIQNRIVRIDYLVNLAHNLDSLGYTIADFSDYLSDLFKADYDIRFSLSKESPNSVQIMTIHTSKGLEFNICYFPLLYKKFNLRELNERFTFSSKYGIITPYFDEGIGKTIYKYLLKNKYINDEISEKIRLFYVALTRAKENMVLIVDFGDDEDEINNNIKNCRSFLNMLQVIKKLLNPYIKNIDLEKIVMSHDYNLTKNTNDILKFETVCEPLNIKNIELENNYEDEQTFSHSTNNFVSLKEQKNLDIGLYFHYLLEIIDFKNVDIDNYNIDDFYKDKLVNFFKQPLLQNINNCNIYKEYEFMEIDDNIKRHGIIDLMIEHENYIDIIDYKFKNITDENYNKQLMGYKNYIMKKTNKQVNIYLYSIMNNEVKLLD